MRRREFIELFGGGLMAWPLPVGAHAANIARVGIIDPAAAGTYSDTYYWSAFHKQMRALGHVEGSTVAFETRWADGDLARLPALTKELVDLGVNVILARSTTVALAARSVTTRIPIVVPLMADPVGVGLVSSLAHPGGNVTGLSTISAELSAKRIELLRDLVPHLTRAAIVWDDTNPSFALTVHHTEAAAKALGLSLQVIPAHAAGAIENILAALEREQAQGLIVAVPVGSSEFGGNFIEFTAVVARQKLPAVYAEKAYVKAGGLASYGPDYIDLFRRAAIYTDKILKGAAPADLPVEEPDKFETVVSLKVAKELGIAISPLLLVRADEVIE
jgi:putative ABC transport system substrate-binding protein